MRKNERKYEERQKQGGRIIRKAAKKDVITIGMEALMSVVGAMGILALGAFVTGSHIVEWNGVGTGIAFVLLALGLWGMMEMRDRKRQMYA